MNGCFAWIVGVICVFSVTPVAAAVLESDSLFSYSIFLFSVFAAGLLLVLAVRLLVRNHFFQRSADVGDRKSTLQDDQHIQELLDLIVDRSPVPAWVGSPDGTVLRANKALYKALNLTEEQIIGKYNLTQDDNLKRADIAEKIDLLLHRKQPVKFELLWKYELVRGIDLTGGRDLYIDVSSYPLLSRNGEVAYVVVQWVDITERHQAEEALLESQKRYQSLFDNAPVPIWEEDFSELRTYISSLKTENVSDFRKYFDSHPEKVKECAQLIKIIDVNRAVLELHEAESKEELFEGLPQIFTDESYEGFKEELIAIAEGKLECKIEGKVRTLSGKEKDVSLTWLVVPGYEDTLKKVYVSTIDITDLKLAQIKQATIQKEFVKRNHFIEMILEYLPIGLGVNRIDDGEVTYLNKKFEEIYGWPRNEFYNIASFFEKVFPNPVKREVIKEKIISDISSGDPERMEWEDLEITTKTGEEKAVYAKNIPIPDQNIMISTAQDVTEKRKLEAQIQQAQKMEAVGRLAGGVAHDFNNMLGIILGHADMLLEKLEPDQPMYAELSEIKKAAVSSADLTRQLLAFARKQTVTPRVIDLNKTVSGMLNMLRRLIGENIDISWIPSETVYPVMIDPSQIDQILANLCVNARGAIDGAGKVTIETSNAYFDEEYCENHAGFRPGRYAMLAVSDNGCGMDSSTIDNIFEPFFTTKEQGKGTGLGLAMVYGAVKQNNGLINVYSELGQGTTFKIYFPCHLLDADHEIESEPDTLSKRGNETILLVEDEPAILKMTATLLESEGYTVLMAATPDEAIHLAAEHASNIHLLMSDVVLPEMNGRELARNILSDNPNLKCLFMSGYTADVISNHGVLDEGVNFIQKPFLKSELTAKLREVLDNH